MCFRRNVFKQLMHCPAFEAYNHISESFSCKSTFYMIVCYITAVFASDMKNPKLLDDLLHLIFLLAVSVFTTHFPSASGQGHRILERLMFYVVQFG